MRLLRCWQYRRAETRGIFFAASYEVDDVCKALRRNRSCFLRSGMSSSKEDVRNIHKVCASFLVCVDIRVMQTIVEDVPHPIKSLVEMFQLASGEAPAIGWANIRTT